MLKTTQLDSSTRPLTPALYRKFGPLIYSRCRRFLQNEELALQATQEVFVRVLRSLHEKVEQGAVEALSTACESVCRELQSPTRKVA